MNRKLNESIEKTFKHNRGVSGNKLNKTIQTKFSSGLQIIEKEKENYFKGLLLEEKN